MHDIVQDYYGRQLKSSSDLKTDACCDASTVPEWLKPLLANIHPEVLSRYYGCGLVCPPLLEGCRVLDLGCGSGRDVYLLSQLVGPSGEVVGVDMTDEQLQIAREHQSYHSEKFGYDNVTFLHGYIEQLENLNLEPGSFDVIVSNCVVNLSTDKGAVLCGLHRLLKDGGEFYFSDVYADRRVPDTLRTDPELVGECLGGALYWNDFLELAKSSGFRDSRLMESRPLEVTNTTLSARCGSVRFYSATYRLFKLAQLEKDCEDYGQAVVYKGTIPSCPHEFILDGHHVIEKGRVFPVCGNTWRMLAETRMAPHFEYIGDFSQHFGLFPGCGREMPFSTRALQSNENKGQCC
ncbi:methyltransferase domain-containing protein [Microbulbifer sp. ANSA001]|uniref:methyltransferase domain-containing protein n=1 Tax=Microbulbifer sp. ANSA001 TaxID=3243358 RepID=UPI0040414F08